MELFSSSVFLGNVSAVGESGNHIEDGNDTKRNMFKDGDDTTKHTREQGTYNSIYSILDVDIIDKNLLYL